MSPMSAALQEREKAMQALHVAASKLSPMLFASVEIDRFGPGAPIEFVLIEPRGREGRLPIALNVEPRAQLRNGQPRFSAGSVTLVLEDVLAAVASAPRDNAKALMNLLLNAAVRVGGVAKTTLGKVLDEAVKTAGKVVGAGVGAGALAVIAYIVSLILRAFGVEIPNEVQQLAAQLGGLITN